MMEKRILSNSDAQAEAEAKQIEDLLKRLSAADLRVNEVLTLKSNPEVTIKPNFYSASAGIIGEIHTHYGKMLPAQKHKVAADVLKMLLFEQDSGRKLQKFIVVCSQREYDWLTGNSYVAQAARMNGIEVILNPLDENLEELVKKARKDQNLYNPQNEQPQEVTL